MRKGGINIKDLFPRWMELIDLSLEKDRARRSLKQLDFGVAVKDERMAHKYYSEVREATHAVLQRDENAATHNPRLVVTRRMERLPIETVRIYGVFLPLSLIFMYMTFQVSGGGVEVWVVRVFVIFLMLYPLIYKHRLRLNIAHDCKYRIDRNGTAIIEIDQLPEKQFKSYLAHEYAHHLFYEKYGDLHDPWVREGWCRLVQWAVVNHLYDRDKNPACLGHTLEQIVGELKCACEMVAMGLRMGLPAPVRRIKTPYSTNSLAAFITGKPGFDVNAHVNHSLGTARFFLAAKRWGLEEALREPRRVVQEVLETVAS